MGKEEIYLKYTPYEMSTIIERLNALNTITAAKDYGTGEKMHTVEVHILSWIAENPGISVTDVALAWNRTKGAVSQIIRKLEESAGQQKDGLSVCNGKRGGTGQSPSGIRFPKLCRFSEDGGKVF